MYLPSVSAPGLARTCLAVVAATALVVSASPVPAHADPAEQAPTVTEHPQDLTVADGEDATFVAAATGTPEPTVQWQSRVSEGDWADVSGAAAVGLTVAAATLDQSGTQYRAVFANQAGQAISEPATLTVSAPEPQPSESAPYLIQDLPATAVGYLGQEYDTCASVIRVGNAPQGASVTWYHVDGGKFEFGYVPEPSPTSFFETAVVDGVLTSVWRTQGRNSLQYSETRFKFWSPLMIYAVVSWTDGLGAEQSLTSTMTTWSVLLREPTISTQPVDTAVDAGQTATFTVADTDGFGATYGWESSADGENWVAVPGAESATLTVTETTVAQSGIRYRAVVTNNAGSVASDPATLTVRPVDQPPEIYAHPVDQAATALTDLVRFSAQAQSTATSAQWQSKVPGGDWADIAGATTLTTTQAGVSSSLPLYIRDNEPKPVDGTQYRVVFGNDVGSSYSESATLTMWTAQVSIAEATVMRGGTVHLSATGLPPDSAVVVKYSDHTGTLVPTSYGVTTSADGTLSDLSASLSIGYYLDTGLPLSGLLPLGDLRLVVAVGTLEFLTNAVTVVDDPDAVIPEITVQPVQRTFAAGEPLVYSVTIADNPGPLYYRWAWKINQATPTEANNGVGEREGNTFTTTTPASTQVTEGSVFRFYAWTPAGIAVSDWVTVLRGDPEAPAVTSQPVSQLAAPGDTVTFTASGSGVTTPDVRWQKRAPLDDDYSDIPGATSDTLTVANVQESDNGTVYRAVYSNQLGEARSGAALLSVTASAQAPQVTAQPQDTSVETGQPASFSAAATGAPSPAVQWYSSRDGQDWAIIVGAASPTLTITATPEALSGTWYKAVFTNTAGVAETNPATLTVTPEPAT
ncbi:MAG: hypothetical protein LBG11_10250, partial [Bifidobacteriaceae bacterium]|nr:hypothetical protein [Bifidobacteriaceae bacterium]